VFFYSRDRAGEQNRDNGIDPDHHDASEQRVGPEPDKRLLPHRDQPTPAGQHVPQLRQRQHREHENQILNQIARGDHGQ